MMNLMRFLLVGLVFMTAALPASALQCRDLFSGSVSKTLITSVKKINRSLPLENLTEIKTEIQSLLNQNEKIDPAMLKTPISKVAFFEVMAERKNWDILSLESALTHGTDKQKKQIEKLVKNIDLDQGITASKFETQMMELYKLTNPDVFQIPLSLKESHDMLLRQRIETAFLKQSMTEAVKDLGLIKNPSLLQKFSQARKKNFNLEKAALTVVSNLVSLMSGTTGYIFPIKFGQRIEIPKEIFDKVEKHGIESARQELSQLFLKSTSQQFKWNLFSRTYNRVSYAIAIYHLLSLAPQIQNKYIKVQDTYKSLNNTEQTMVNPQVIRSQAFESWKESFFETNGRYPDPALHPTDKGEWDRVWNDIKTTPDAQLTTDYSLYSK